MQSHDSQFNAMKIGLRFPEIICQNLIWSWSMIKIYYSWVSRSKWGCLACGNWPNESHRVWFIRTICSNTWLSQKLPRHTFFHFLFIFTWNKVCDPYCPWFVVLINAQNLVWIFMFKFISELVVQQTTCNSCGKVNLTIECEISRAISSNMWSYFQW